MKSFQQGPNRQPHYNRFRYYDPSVGRYTSADPVGQFGIAISRQLDPREPGFPQRRSISGVLLSGHHPFEYALSNSLRFFDAYGDKAITGEIYLPFLGHLGARISGGFDRDGYFFLSFGAGFGFGASLVYDPDPQPPGLSCPSEPRPLVGFSGILSGSAGAYFVGGEAQTSAGATLSPRLEGFVEPPSASPQLGLGGQPDVPRLRAVGLAAGATGNITFFGRRSYK